jgi:hypothetical protein
MIPPFDLDDGEEIEILRERLTFNDVSLLVRSIKKDTCKDLYDICRQGWSKKTEERTHDFYHKIYKKGMRHDDVTNQKSIFIRLNVDHKLASELLNDFYVVYN